MIDIAQASIAYSAKSTLLAKPQVNFGARRGRRSGRPTHDQAAAPEPAPASPRWKARMNAGRRWDAIVVGAGHNGLTAGAMLARAGLATLELERRDLIGGACVTEEIAPGCRASTTSYIASMLRPEVIKTLELGKHGLRMVPCEPAVQVALEGGEVLAHWTDQARTRAGIQRYSVRDALAFEAATKELRQLSARLQPMLTELPPDTRAGTLRGAAELVRMATRLRGMRGADIEGLTRLISSSLGDYIDARFTSPQVKALLLANNLYGKHGGPYQPGTLIGLVFHMLTGGDQEEQGFFRHLIGRIGPASEGISAPSPGPRLHHRRRGPGAPHTAFR